MTTPNPRIVAGAYEIDGARYPRVSAVLDILHKPGLQAWKLRVGAEESERVSREATGLGTQVHALLEQVNRGGGQRVVTTQALLPYVDAYVAWFAAHVARVLHVEKLVIHEQHGYAGTADLVAEMRDGRVLLIDLKTSNSLTGEYRLQCAAYADALAYMGEPVDGRMVVNLPSRRPGELRTIEYDDDERDLRAWRACLRLYKWHERHKDDWRTARGDVFRAAGEMEP